MNIFVLHCTLLLMTQAVPQAPSQSIRPIGAVLTMDLSAKRITIKSDAGPELRISFDDATRFLRVAPGAKDLQNATSISVSDIAVGDRILARGRAGDDGSFAATSIIVMGREDLARKQAAERADWRKRGIGGTVASLDPASKEITIARQTSAGTKSTVIVLAPGALLRRYAPNSVKFSDAVPGRFEELKVGDQVRARGNMNEDQSRFTAEELVWGSFRTIAATVVAVEPGQSSIQIAELATDRQIQVQVTPDSSMHRLSADVAQMLAVRIQGGTKPAAPGAHPNGGDLQSAIERLPQLSLADLKAGEAVLLTGTKGDDPSHVTAVTILAGTGQLLKTKEGKTLDLGSWNLDLDMNVGGP